MNPHSTPSNPPGEVEKVYMLLERYWLGETLSEESAYVQAWLLAHPEWAASYEKLRFGLRVGDKTEFSDQEVNRMVQKALEAVGIHRERTIPAISEDTTPGSPAPQLQFTKQITSQVPTSRDDVSVAAPIRGSSHEPEPLTISQTLWNRMSGRIQRPAASPPLRGNDESSASSRNTRYTIAYRAFFSVFAVIVATVSILQVWEAIRSVNTQPSTYSTGNGERATITLPDGSVVMLNVSSRIQVPGDYAAGNRKLRLDGEAAFIVTARSSTPFIVEAGSAITRVLGTRFAVRYYETDSAVTIAVQDGKVAVNSKVITDGQQVSVTNQHLGAVQPISHARFSFVTGKLIVDDVPLLEAISELNRWYDVDIRLGDRALAGRNVFAVCDTGSLADLMMILEWSLDLRVERNGKVLTLYPRG